MERPAATAPAECTHELHALFVQRTHVCLWLGMVFFPLFSILDYLYCRSFFTLFLTYRLCFVLLLAGLLLFLKTAAGVRHARAVMAVALLFGTLAISLMTVKLDGFVSGYYVGILLMVAGAFSVLPLHAVRALLLGSAMYLVYVVTVAFFVQPIDARQLGALVSNSVFFFSLVIVTALQCFDEIQTIIRSLRTKKSLQAIHAELRQYTGDLEALVQQRVEMLEESDLKFHDLYNTIPDLVVLLNEAGTIRMINRHGAFLLEQTPEELEETSLVDCIPPQYRQVFSDEVLDRLQRGETVQGVQVQLHTRSGRTIEAELSGSRVELAGESGHYQLIIRDISQTKEIERQVIESGQLLDTSRRAAIFGLARLAECRDDSTGAHLLRIREYTRILALGLAENPRFRPIVTGQFIEDLCLSSVLHDIGKVGIPDAILLKPDLLSEAEFETMKRHCQYGSNALASAEHDAEGLGFLRMGEEIALYHHERWDGTGYPTGLAGTAIPLSARIVALADVYDALTSSRCYKPALHHEQARMLIVRESGRQFDPAVVNAFVRRERDFKAARRDLLMQTPPPPL
ncbi:HD domain-containing phosphohydrolase [Desulfobulbus elongatus]|uniref:HD domain-containing phosphohydrolase n=1 Tax=Desulfobulbus elongatus TaxID=53332 RepID=UPI00068702FB|nr:HD domain-containing phosphohydrolase [Desulfobulbus elongatus]